MLLGFAAKKGGKKRKNKEEEEASVPVSRRAVAGCSVKLTSSFSYTVKLHKAYLGLLFRGKNDCAL